MKHNADKYYTYNILLVAEGLNLSMTKLCFCMQSFRGGHPTDLV